MENEWEFIKQHDPTLRAVHKLRELAWALLEMEDDPGAIHQCPVCGGEAHIEITAYNAGDGKEKLGIRISCEGCQVITAMDGRGPIPEWARR